MGHRRRSIGEAIAHTFAGEGAKTVVVDLERTSTELDGVVQAIRENRGEATTLAADATDAAKEDRMVSDVVSWWGSLEILVSSVGCRRPMVQVHEITGTSGTRPSTSRRSFSVARRLCRG